MNGTLTVDAFSEASGCSPGRTALIPDRPQRRLVGIQTRSATNVKTVG